MLRPAVDLEPRRYETIWIGDDAVDRDASAGALQRWTETGETDGLTMRSGIEPSPITYRALTTREVSQLPLLDGSGGAIVSLCYEAARYGLLAIRGLRLRYARHHGIRGLADASLDLLAEYHAEIPIMLLHARWLRGRGFELEPDPSGPADDAAMTTDLAQWIGGLVLAATFRSGRGDP